MMPRCNFTSFKNKLKIIEIIATLSFFVMTDQWRGCTRGIGGGSTFPTGGSRIMLQSWRGWFPQHSVFTETLSKYGGKVRNGQHCKLKVLVGYKKRSQPVTRTLTSKGKGWFYGSFFKIVQISEESWNDFKACYLVVVHTKWRRFLKHKMSCLAQRIFFNSWTCWNIR